MGYFTTSRAKILSLLFHVSLLYISVSGLRSCPTSLDTARITNHCPANQDAWLERERMFKCSSHKQNCTNPELFMYHCIPNAWQNRLIEVCAIRTTIIGWKCPEFNFGGKMVQEHNKEHCQSCPFQYNSTDAFKYQECFEFEKNNSFQIHFTTTFSKEPSSTTLASALDCTGFGCFEVTVGRIVEAAATALLLIVAVFVFVIYKKRSGKYIITNWERHLDKEADPKGFKSNDSEEEDTLLEKGDIFKSLTQRKITTHDPLHTGYFSKTGQKHSPYIPSTHDKSFPPAEEKPVFIDYISKSTRVLSFTGFSMQEIVDNLASAGFFYTGYYSSTMCFHCGCEKGDWKLGDDAILEHKRLNNTCSFVRDIENAREQAILSQIKEA